MSYLNLNLEKEFLGKKIIVTGCAAQINPDTYSRIDNVDLVLGNNEKMNETIWKNIHNLKPVQVKNIFKEYPVKNHIFLIHNPIRNIE